MPTLIGANRAFCGEFQTEVGMPARSALRLPCRRRHGNRFLLIAVDRSKLLPFGSALHAEHLATVRDAVHLALRFAAAHHPLALDPAARERWIDIYPDLSAGQPGLAGAATARAEAHVIRLALIYALLDATQAIRLEHLEAALAVWAYSAASARWIFGDTLGDPTADEIWAVTKERPAGVTRTEVSDMFSRNKKRREIDRALFALEEAGRLRRELRQGQRGRSAEVWIPVCTTHHTVDPLNPEVGVDRPPVPSGHVAASPRVPT